VEESRLLALPSMGPEIWVCAAGSCCGYRVLGGAGIAFAWELSFASRIVMLRKDPLPRDANDLCTTALPRRGLFFCAADACPAPICRNVTV